MMLHLQFGCAKVEKTIVGWEAVRLKMIHILMLNLLPQTYYYILLDEEGQRALIDIFLTR